MPDQTLGGLLGPRPHQCDDRCAHTVEVGDVHVRLAHGGPCRDSCPHPDHRGGPSSRVGEWGGE